MKKLTVENDVVMNLPDEEGFESPIAACESRQKFEAWCDGLSEEAMAARFENTVHVKIPRRLNEDGEFSLDYDCLPLDEANVRIDRWNAAQPT